MTLSVCESILRWHLNRTYNYAYHNCSTVLITLLHFPPLSLSLVFLFEIRRIRFSDWFCWHSVLNWKWIKRLCQSFLSVNSFEQWEKKAEITFCFFICLHMYLWPDGKKTKNYSHRSPALNRIYNDDSLDSIYISFSLSHFFFFICDVKKKWCMFVSLTRTLKKWRWN